MNQQTQPPRRPTQPAAQPAPKPKSIVDLDVLDIDSWDFDAAAYFDQQKKKAKKSDG